MALAGLLEGFGEGAYTGETPLWLFGERDLHHFFDGRRDLWHFNV